MSKEEDDDKPHQDISNLTEEWVHEIARLEAQRATSTEHLYQRDNHQQEIDAPQRAVAFEDIGNFIL